MEKNKELNKIEIEACKIEEIYYQGIIPYNKTKYVLKIGKPKKIDILIFELDEIYHKNMEYYKAKMIFEDFKKCGKAFRTCDNFKDAQKLILYFLKHLKQKIWLSQSKNKNIIELKMEVIITGNQSELFSIVFNKSNKNPSEVIKSLQNINKIYEKEFGTTILDKNLYGDLGTSPNKIVKNEELIKSFPYTKNFLNDELLNLMRKSEFENMDLKFKTEADFFKNI